MPVWTKESQLSLSGPCTKALRAAQQGADPAELALGVETAIGQGLSKVLGYLCGKYNVTKVLLAGGVSANGEIRRQVGSALTKQVHPAGRQAPL